MTESQSSDPESSYSIAEKIDQICDQFEQEIRNGALPRIEHYLGRVEPAVQHRLLRDLVAVEYEFFRQLRKVDFTEYFKRFPQASEMLLSLHRELESSDSQGQKTLPAQPTGDMTVMADNEPRPRLSNFRLLEVAGSGGFGTVWRALDLRLQREVAVKIPRLDRADRIRLPELMREAQTAAKLKHPNIVSVHEVGQENGISFIVTDYINGVNLREWRKHHKISAFDAARMIAKLAEAVQHAHEKGVIHRDLKLANVLMDDAGEPHVADFGLAKREARDDSLAVEGKVLGTPAYMAPEQARADHAAIDRRTDVYALGVMLYELITGATPFRGDIDDLLQQIVDVPPVAPRLVKPEIPRDLDAICLKCLAKENAKRYDSTQALADDLYLFLNGQTLRGVPAAMPTRIWKWFRRNRRFVFITAAVTFLVASLSSGAIAWRYHASIPPVASYVVEFTTDPKGCEITVVPIDGETGEPNPTKIKKARGTTPVKMSLASGDYLVVAVLESQNLLRFNEAFRHVPEPGEVPFNYVSRKWTRRSNGEIGVPEIRIPRPDVTLGMGFCEGADRLIERPLQDDAEPRAWRIPSFYVDPREVTIADLIKWKAIESRIPKDAPDSSAIQSYSYALEELEKQGKRQPSAAESYLLAKVICRTDESAVASADECELADKTLISGLHSGAREWTSTRPGGPFTGLSAPPKSMGYESVARTIGCGLPDGSDSQRPLGFRIGKEYSSDAGYRGVRSEKPRRTPQDFAAIVDR